VSYKTFVEDEENIMEGDIATLQVTLKRENPIKNEPANCYAKSFRYPCLKEEKWYVFFVDLDKKADAVFDKKIINSIKDVQEEKFRFPADKLGKKSLNYMLRVIVIEEWIKNLI